MRVSLAELEFIQSITTKLVEKAGAESVYLFGSYARGEQTEDSDFDFLMIKPSNLPQYERAKEARLTLIPYKWPLDLFVFTPTEFEQDRKIVGTIPYAVAKEGILLYGCHCR